MIHINSGNGFFFLEEHPQIHFHYIQSEETSKRVGYGKIELCCHGCARSLIALYDLCALDGTPPSSEEHQRALRNEFINSHLTCRNYGYNVDCPEWRRGVEFVDLRSCSE